MEMTYREVPGIIRAYVDEKISTANEIFEKDNQLMEKCSVRNLVHVNHFHL